MKIIRKAWNNIAQYNIKGVWKKHCFEFEKETEEIVNLTNELNFNVLF